MSRIDWVLRQPVDIFILELGAKTPHQRVPLIMGSVRGVRDVTAIHEAIEPMFDNSDAPLFARRGLFR